MSAKGRKQILFAFGQPSRRRHLPFKNIPRGVIRCLSCICHPNKMEPGLSFFKLPAILSFPSYKGRKAREAAAPVLARLSGLCACASTWPLAGSHSSSSLSLEQQPLPCALAYSFAASHFFLYRAKVYLKKKSAHHHFPTLKFLWLPRIFGVRVKVLSLS